MLKLKFILLVSFVSILGATYSHAQQKSLSSTIGVYVFPEQGQDSSQQSKDEAECYDWAVENTGSDPFDLANQNEAAAQQAEAQKQAAEQAGQGAGAKGAAGGALGGAIIGEIVDDDPGEGAAYGAALGAIAGRRKARKSESQATQQADAQQQSTAAATGAQLEEFEKAFSVCLEAKNYMVKY